MGDLRTKRTYKLLQDALFELLSKKAFDEINNKLEKQKGACVCKSLENLFANIEKRY